MLLKVSLQTFKGSCGERTTGFSGRNPGQCSVYEDFVLCIVKVLGPAFIHLWSYKKLLLTLPEQLWSLERSQHELKHTFPVPLLFHLGFLHECFLNRQWHKRVRKAFNYFLRSGWITRGLSKQSWWHLGDMLIVSVAARWMVDFYCPRSSAGRSPSNTNTLSLMQHFERLVWRIQWFAAVILYIAPLCEMIRLQTASF